MLPAEAAEMKVWPDSLRRPDLISEWTFLVHVLTLGSAQAPSKGFGRSVCAMAIPVQQISACPEKAFGCLFGRELKHIKSANGQLATMHAHSIAG